MKFELKECAVAVVAKRNNPTILNPDFLKINEIVPQGLQVSGPALCTEPVSQVRFDNGLSVVAQLEKLVFAQNLDGKTADEIEVASVACKYLRVLPHVDYLAFGLNPKGHVEFPTVDDARDFVNGRLIADGPWREINGCKALSSCKMIYQLEGVVLTISVDVAAWPKPEGDPIPVVTFGGNYHRDISGAPGKEKVERICKLLQNWEQDLASFNSMVEGRFLQE